jgi:hypothetical protein
VPDNQVEREDVERASRFAVPLVPGFSSAVVDWPEFEKSLASEFARVRGEERERAAKVLAEEFSRRRMVEMRNGTAHEAFDLWLSDAQQDQIVDAIRSRAGARGES